MSLEICIARALDELEEIYRLRYQIYLQVGYIKKEEYLDEKETDEYDKYSTHFYAYSTEEDRIVGAIRLVHDSKLGFPLEELYDISFLRKQNKNIVEVSRRLTLPNRAKANYGLMQISCQYSIKHGIDTFIFSLNPQDLDFYNKLGCIQFGKLEYYNKMHMPAMGMYIFLDKFKSPYDKRLFTPAKNIIL